MIGGHYVVVGAGSIAKRHIQNIKRALAPSRVTCVSASGRRLSPGDVGADYVSASFEETLKNRPEWCVIASPAPFHLDHALPYLKRGIPVLIEKPVLHVSHKSAERQLLEYKGLIDVGYNFRLFPALQALKKHIGLGSIGRVLSVDAQVGQYLPDWRPHQDYRKGVSAQKCLGGGALLELSHELDYLSWILGFPRKLFCSARKSGVLDIDVEDCVDAMFEYPDGVVATVHLDFLQRAPSRTCKVIGSEGTLILDFINNTLSLYKASESKVLYSDITYERNDMYEQELLRFDKFARGTIEPLVGIDMALNVMRMVDVMKQSSDLREMLDFEVIS